MPSDSPRPTTTSHPATPPSMRRRRRVQATLDPVTLAALRELLAPPAEREGDAERFVADVMMMIHAERDAAVAAGVGDGLV